MKKSSNNIDTGKLIEQQLNAKRFSKTELAIKINRSSQSINKYLENSSIQTGILLDMCHAFKHNFFHDIANQLPADFSVSRIETEGGKSTLELLIEENNVLKIQNELLMKIRG